LRPMTHSFKRALARSLALVAAFAAATLAQSSDVGRPTPIFTGDVAGRIAPRDVGDARLTRHFYAFTGREGDLFITVESTGLNGDFDLFTASALRPLLKITVLPTSSGYFVKKSVYLRRDEPLILRVEGRALGEADARYRIKLEGAYGPATGAFAENPPAESVESADERGDRRTTSAGARIPRPVVEPTPVPEAPAEEARAEPTPEESRTTAEPSRAGTRRGSRGTRGAGRTTARGRTAPAREPDAAATRPDAERDTEEAEASPTPTTRTNPPRRTTGRGGRARPAAGEPGAGTGERPSPAGPTDAEEAPGARLIIVTKDGETIERDMRSVRRVTVERGQIVIIGTDGRVSRVVMTNVVRMAIEP
jgi:hypothetical protein